MHEPGPARRVIVLGSTGSIGTQTLDVIERLNELAGRGAFPHRFGVVGLACGGRIDRLAEQCARFGVAHAAVCDQSAPRASIDGLSLLTGDGAAEQLVREVECDLVVAAIVGSAGLRATLAACELGRDVALANKEALVAAGPLVVGAARRTGARLLPVDSEHAAAWQCLGALAPGQAPPMDFSDRVRRLVLTASGGALRDLSPAERFHATPDMALAHPTWSMGPKVTIDSATLMNKALEIIEAHHLFALPGERISAVIHRQSVVHAMVELADGSILAQLAPADMRVPIQQALAWPHRPPSAWDRLGLDRLGALEFDARGVDEFPAIALAYDVIERGGLAGAVMTAANEAAVGAYLSGQGEMPLGSIAELTRGAVEEFGAGPLRDLDDALQAERFARSWVARACGLRESSVTELHR